MSIRTDSTNILLPEFAPPGRRCINCKFYFRLMSRYAASAIQRNFENEGIYIEYLYGQKFCIKNNYFTYFNSYCTEHINLHK